MSDANRGPMTDAELNLAEAQAMAIQKCPDNVRPWEVARLADSCRRAVETARRAQAVAAAERALRIAVDEWAMNMTAANRRACREKEEALRALGVEP